MTIRMLRAALCAVAVGLAAIPALAQEAKLDSLKIMAPAAPGGGWDQTARTLQQALQENGIVKTVQVSNVPGAGGTVGLAQFAQGRDGKSMMVGGMVMVGAILTNKSAVTLDQVTPIARLTGEYEAVVVPAKSDIKTMADLVKKMKENPKAVSWAGGSAGGTDHILVGLIAKALGAKPADVNYVPYSGGGEALAAVLGGHVTAGVSGAGEWQQQIQSGELRALAVSGPTRLPKIDAPTLKEAGIDVELANWRGIFAPGNIQPQDRDALVAVVEAAAKSKTWQDALAKREQIDLLLTGDKFAAYLKEDRARIEAVLKDIGLVK